jgi:hypothetical protein
MTQVLFWAFDLFGVKTMMLASPRAFSLATINAT